MEREFIDEYETDYTHDEITKAIWKAKLSTKFIRTHFPIAQDTDQEGQLYRFYKLDKKGLGAIKPFLRPHGIVTNYFK